MQIFMKALKLVVGIILGLIFSLVTIVGLEVLLPKPNPFRRPGFNLWLVGPVIVFWLFICLWFMLRKPSRKKIQTKGIELLPNSIAELIDDIIDAMKYRRSVRADVRQELTDHFTDALADCQDEQQKQERIKELIKEFGDAQLLGKLLRRAKKRCRPLWRTIAARTFQLIGILILLMIVYIGWFFTGKPVITTNYLDVMNQQVRPVAEESQNAWPFYKQAAEKYVKYENEDKDKKFDFSPRNSKILSEEERGIIMQAISNNRESLELIRKGNQKPYYWEIYGTGENEGREMIAMLLPNLSDYKKLTYLMCWQAQFNAEQGKLTESLNDLIEIYVFGQHLRGQNTTLIEQLVAIAIEAMSTNTLRMVLSEYDEKIDAALLESARSRFEAVIAGEDFTIAFGAEKLCMYDEAQRCFTESRFGKSHLYFQRLGELGEFSGDEGAITFLFGMNPIHILFTHPDKEETLKEVEQFYAKMEEMAALTPASVKSQGLEMDRAVKDVMENNVFLSILTPALEKVTILVYRNRIDAEATLAVLAVLQYQKQHGVFPETLNVLVENGLLKKVPIDPYSDKPLVYKKTDSGFTVYSVGANFTDDGGIPATDERGKNRQWGENGDRILWPVTDN